LTGLVSAVFAFAAFASSSPPPNAKADGARVIAFYQTHSSGQQASDFLWTFAFAFFLLFAGSLRAYLRRTSGTEALSTVMLAGAAVMTAGAIIFFCFDYALAVVPSHLAPAAAQTLNVLALNFVLPFAAGGFVFGIACGLTILHGTQLPDWLGWVAIATGLITATPAALAGLLTFILWSAIVSILIWKRSPEDATKLDADTPKPTNAPIS